MKLGFLILLSTVLVPFGCDIVPPKPDAVFALYRERMRSQKIEEARSLLLDDSRAQVDELASKYKLQQLPEDLALLSILDPLDTPVAMKTTDTFALIQLRTLRGGVRLIKLVRKNSESPWKIDLSEELSGLRSFLEAQGALEMIREQAGEYAASWKAMTDHLSKMKVPEPAPEPPTPAASHAVKPKPKPKIKAKKEAKQTSRSNGR